MSDGVVASVPHAQSLGEKLRALRRSQGQSLEEVANATGISRSLLSLVETGKNDLTVGRLIRLMDFYGVLVTDLLPQGTEDRPEIVRRAHQRRIRSRSEKMDLFYLLPDASRAIELVIAVYQPGGATAEFLSFDAEQTVHVLEGAIALTFEGEAPIVLEVGDSAGFSARRPHKYSNDGDQIARVMHARSPAS